MKQPKKEDGVEGEGLSCSRGFGGFGLLPMGNVNLILGKLKSSFHRTYSSHENGSFI